MRNAASTHEPMLEDVWYIRYLDVMVADLIEMAVLPAQGEMRIRRGR
jgi:hypothetical protein